MIEEMGDLFFGEYPLKDSLSPLQSILDLGEMSVIAGQSITLASQIPALAINYFLVSGVLECLSYRQCLLYRLHVEHSGIL